MARLLIVGGGQRGITLAEALRDRGHVSRIVTDDQSRRQRIESAGAECWIGTPQRLGTVTAALEGVTIACWMLGAATGPDEEVEALHGSLLSAFLGKAIDTTVRGVLYESAGTVGPSVLRGGEEIARRLTERNAIPLRILDADPGQRELWLAQAQRAISELLGEA